MDPKTQHYYDTPYNQVTRRLRLFHRNYHVGG